MREKKQIREIKKKSIGEKDAEFERNLHNG